MNRVGRLFICIAAGVALSVTARGGVTPYANVNVNAFRGNTNLMNRIELMKKHHMNHPPGFPQMQHPNTLQANIPQADVPRPFKKAPATDIHPTTVAAPAAPVTPSGNPYESIVTRNVFGLNPIPPPTVQPDTPPGPPPPKITLTGIMTIFGPPEALFKVAGVVRNGRSPHDESYIFTEGEMQDDVEVTAIDTNKMVVTFMNHGVHQEIGLTEGVASAGSAPSAPTFPGQPMRRFGRFNRFGGGNPGGFQPQSYANPYGGGGNNGSSSGNNNPFGGNNNGGGSFNGTSYTPSSQANLSPDDQAALVAAEHAQAVQQGSPTAILYPSTQYDKQAMDEMGGAGSNPGGGSPTAPTPPHRPGY